MQRVSDGGGARADPQPDRAEIAIAGAPFPQPQPVKLALAVGGDLERDVQVRIVVAVKAALDVVRVDHLLAQLGQALLIGAFAFGFFACVAEKCDQGDHRRGHHRKPHRDQQHHTAPLPAGADDDIADDGDHRQCHLDQLLFAAGFFGGRRGDDHLADGQFRLDARGAVGEFGHGGGLLWCGGLYIRSPDTAERLTAVSPLRTMCLRCLTPAR